jgi:septum formation protein
VLTVVLASASPRRAELLDATGVHVIVRPTDVDEAPLPGEGAVAHARRLAQAKLEAALLPDREPVPHLAADTVVWLPPNGPPIGKPRDVDEARAVIRRLTEGPPHRVTTAWALGMPDGRVEVHEETTTVWMRPLDPHELHSYLLLEEWRDKAGGYGIQSKASSWVTRIEGSYTNVVGLPVAQVVGRLRASVRTPHGGWGAAR